MTASKYGCGSDVSRDRFFWNAWAADSALVPAIATYVAPTPVT